MKLHLGCSDDYKSNWLNVDCTPPPAGSTETRNSDMVTWRTPKGFIYQQADLNAPWPWEDSTVDEIVANDVFEHLSDHHWGYFQLADGRPVLSGELRLHGTETHPHRAAFEIPGKIWAMNEAHRVLKPGGILNFTVPCVTLSNGRVNPGAFCDPTHRTFWTLDDCFYFGEQWNTPDMERGRLGPAYGITALFRFPLMFDYGAKGWHVLDQGSKAEPLRWKLEEANGRAKIRARIEAVK